VKAILLCGGVGRRMHPLRDDKYMLDFLGRPLLLHIIERLRSAGIDEVVLVAGNTGYANLSELAPTIEGVTCHVVNQLEAKGMADAMEAARDHLTGPVLVVSSNDVVEPSAYRAVTDVAADPDVDCALLACRVTDYFPGGYLHVDADMRVSHIVEKPGAGSEPSDLVNVVVHYHRDPHTLLETIRREPEGQDDRYERALEALMQKGYRTRAVPYEGFWGALKRPWDVFAAMYHFLGGMRQEVSPTAQVAEGAIIKGPVVVEEGARIMEHAVIKGPAYIGRDAIIGNNALVREFSHIGAGAVVGFGTEVKHSYIGKNCWFHSNYVGDSIIDDGCSFGSGCVTANLRFDEGVVNATVDGRRHPTGHNKLGVIMGRNCRTGINASLFPGVMVGPDAIVGPHVCLTGDLGRGEYARTVPNYEVVTPRQMLHPLDRSGRRGSLEARDV